MKFIPPFLLFVLLSLGLSNCSITNYQYVSPHASQNELNSEIIKDSINSTLYAQLFDRYSSYNFGKLITNKPSEFLILDSLYKQRSGLTKRKKKHKEDYNFLLNNLNQEINKVKKDINSKKLFHTYQMDHIYIVTNLKGPTLHEDQFLFLPNFKLKKITPLLSTLITDEEKTLFDYFSRGYPLFETTDNIYNEQMDELVYTKFNNALASEKNNKAALIHTILYSVAYIREYNSFDYEEIAQGIAVDWINKNQPDSFVPKFEQIREISNNDEITSYSLTANNKKGVQSIIFIFDLNLVITDIKLK